MSCCFLAIILMGTIYLFAGKLSYIVLNEAVYEKVVEMSTKRRQCRNNPDVFCYICGEYIMAKYRFNVRDFTKRAYEAYFDMKLGDQDKSWARHKVCKHCTKTLRFWTQGKVSLIRFGFSMVWRERKNHHVDCYFCMVDMCRPTWNQRKKKIVITQILSLLDDPRHIAMKFQFQFSLPYLTLLQMNDTGSEE